ncbi:MAG: TIGR03905 family TSCPD domain-containing protein [Elusimicrobiales bacterium]|nr:TIGR03905 family TSCPD domain-containing protein [Elusimicrobiales bacterium]
MKHKLEGVCSKEVSFKVVGGRLKDVKFYRGCPGNLKALALLLEGMKVKEAAAKLKGITCGDKPTSCSDQLAKVLEKIVKTAK